MTIYGAIGNCLHEPFFFHVQKTVNAEDYMRFINGLKDRVRGLSEKPVLYFDGCTSHLTENVLT